MGRGSKLCSRIREISCPGWQRAAGTVAPVPSDSPDPFDTAGIRRRVLAAWRDSPARFREDANAEEDLVTGGYRDRLLVELAQNAADAAASAGVDGRLRLSLDGDVLSAANVGSPLDSAGVQGLSTLRASGKRAGGTVGRFGVGFAAVLAVSDAPEIRSRDGGVAFSAERTRTMVDDVAELGDELGRRGGAVPVLRLPFPCTDPPIEGYDTEVRLPLRAGARAIVEQWLAALSADLLLALPGLTEIDLGDRVLRRSGTRAEIRTSDGSADTTWRVARRTGDLDPTELAERPVEERSRTTYAVTCAVPVRDSPTNGNTRETLPLKGAQVIHAPTPSDEQISLPVRLIADYPLDPDRRNVAPGVVADAISRTAAAAYADLITGLATDPSALTLVPRIASARSELDARLSAYIMTELRERAWLPSVFTPDVDGEPDQDALVAPDRAIALDPATDDWAEVVGVFRSGVLPADWCDRAARPALQALGISRIGPAEIIAEAGTLDRPADWWGRFYVALRGLGRLEDRDALSALPIPLADGRTAFGAAGVLLPEPGIPVASLSIFGLPFVAADLVSMPNARDALQEWGAQPITLASLLRQPELRDLVSRSADDDEAEEIAAAILALAADAGHDLVGEHPWLAELALPDDQGDWVPAGELILPGSPLADVLEPGSLGLVDLGRAGHTAATLTRVGVLARFAVVEGSEVDLDDPDSMHDLDGETAWRRATLELLPHDDGPYRVERFAGVRDLDLVADGAWPTALTLLVDLPDEVWPDAIVRGRSGVGHPVPSYTRWWLRRRPILDGRSPAELRHPDAVELAGLYDPADADPAVLDLLGLPRDIADLLRGPDTALDLLARLGDPDRSMAEAQLRTVYPRLARRLSGLDVPVPDLVRVAADRVVPAEAAMVLDSPYLLGVLDRDVVPAAGAAGDVADLLDLPLASELVGATRPRTTEEARSSWPDVPGAELAAIRLGRSMLHGSVAWHHELTVQTESGPRRVSWWPEGEVDHVDRGAGAAALGRAVAWRHDAWELRAAVAEAFAHPEDAERLRAEDGAGPI